MPPPNMPHSSGCRGIIHFPTRYARTGIPSILILGHHDGTVVASLRRKKTEKARARVCVCVCVCVCATDDRAYKSSRWQVYASPRREAANANVLLHGCNLPKPMAAGVRCANLGKKCRTLKKKVTPSLSYLVYADALMMARTSSLPTSSLPRTCSPAF